MNTVQRSPRRVGLCALNASRANSPLMLMPSFSACSSRKDPVPAAQASFMAKSTTTPFSMEMNFESWPPISKIVSTGSPPSVLLMWIAPVLCAVISSFTTSAPTNSAISSRPLPVVPTPRIFSRLPQIRSTSASPCCTASIGRPAVRRYTSWITAPNSSIATTLVDTDPMSRPRYAAIGSPSDRWPAGGTYNPPPSPPGPQLHHVLRGERLRVLDALFHIVLPQAVYVQNGAFALLLRLQNGRPDGPAPGVFLRHEELFRGQREGLAQRPHHAGILRHGADQRHRRRHRPPLHHRTLEIAGDRIAQPAQDLRRRIALLLRVDHVALGEHAAASRNPRRASRAAHQFAHLFHRVLHAQRLLVQKRSRAGRALARAVVILNPPVLQPYVLGTLPAQFEHRAHPRVPGGHHARDRLEFVLEKETEHLGNRPASAARHSNAFHAILGYDFVQFMQQVVGGLDRAARNATVIGKQQWTLVQRDQAELRIRRAHLFQGRPVRRFTQSGELKADGPDVQTDIDRKSTRLNSSHL